MIKISKNWVVFLLLILSVCIGSLFPQQGELRIRIPIRIKKIKVTADVLDSLKLFINKKEAKILSKTKVERSINKESILGRNFILSFMNFEKYNKKLGNGISYFVTEILKKSDTLIIHTNINIHQIKVTENKERMILEIENRLKKDMNYVARKSARVLKSINGEIFKIERYFRASSPSDPISADGILYFKFFATIIPEIQFFRNEFVIPEKDRFREIHKLLGFREGDRYWIFFQNSNIFPFKKRIQNIVKLARFNLSQIVSGDSSWKKMVNSKIREMSDSMHINNQYPEKKVKRGLINTKTSFMSLIYDAEKKSSPNKANELQLQEILKKISLDTGGVSLNTYDLEEGLKDLREHKDLFWDIEFVLPEKPGRKKIRFTIEPEKVELSYRKKFEDEELSDLRKNLSTSKISIDQLMFRKNKVSFSIRSFSLNKRGGFGLLKVIIQSFNSMGKEVFRKSNTLRAGKKRINISTGIPPGFSAGHLIRVSVLDMISNRIVVQELKEKD